MKFIFLTFVTLAAFFEGLGDVLLKKWAITSERSIFLILGLLVYFVGTMIWALSLKYEFLSKAISVVTILNLLVVVLVGVLYFKEQLSWLNLLGIGLAIVSIILIEA